MGISPPILYIALICPDQESSALQRPVWLLSMDSDQFNAPPTTTAALTAYFRANGATRDSTRIELVHFQCGEDVAGWQDQWQRAAREGRGNMGTQPASRACAELLGGHLPQRRKKRREVALARPDRVGPARS